MPTPDQVIQQRIINGVNRLEDARIGDPGSWYATINLYGRQPGILAKRPGSRLLVYGRGPIAVGEDDPDIIVPTTRWDVASALMGPGEADLAASVVTEGVLRSAYRSDTFATVTNSLLGTRQLRPKYNAIAVAPNDLTHSTDALPFLRVPVQRVAGLHRIYFDQHDRWLVGAYNLEGGNPDQLFYVEDESAYLIPTVSDITSGEAVVLTSGADFFFTPVRMTFVDGEAVDPKYSYWAMATNQVDQPLAIKMGGTTEGDKVRVTALAVHAQNAGVAADVPMLYAAQSIVVWQGAVVYGGFRMRDNQGGLEQRYDNHVTFSDPGEPHLLAQTDGAISTVQIGDSENEPVTAMAVTSTPTDSQGIKAQLCVFTGKRVAIFDGLPPITDSPLGTNFQSVITGIVGCNAPRTVVTTSKGVVFLGSDGCIYIVDGTRGVVQIGTAIQSVFANLSPRQQKQCSAVWDPEGFYKLSYPDVNPSGNVRQWEGLLDHTRKAKRPEADVPDRQFWGDLRGIGQPAIDLGVKWYGPMVGMKHSCSTVANGAQDRGELYAGSAVDGSIYQIALPDEVTDPTPGDPNTDAYIEAGAVTGLYDLGDAHVDKLITALSFGFGTDRGTTVVSSIIVNADNSAMVAEDVFTRVITPTGSLLGSTFTLDLSPLTSGDTFELITERPEDRLRGKTFRFTFYETPAAGAKVFFSDLSFRAIIATRRI